MKVVIIGAGTGAIGVANILVRDKNFELFGFIGTAEEEAKLAGTKLYGNIPFLGDHSLIPDLRQNDVVGFVVAISDNSLKEKAFYKAIQGGLTPINVISSHSLIEPYTKIGKGVTIGPGCIISHGVNIGDNTYLSTNVFVGINTKIGENCVFHATCAIGGECKIGRNTKFAMGSTLLSYIQVGKHQHIEAGAIVSESLPDLSRREF